jgi:subtilisin-like proprotein convertase family protein
MKFTNLLFALAISFASFSSLSAQEVTFDGDLGPSGTGAIPDDGGTVGGAFSCVVEGVGKLEKFNFINLNLDITHGWTSDLTATLISPNGTRLKLFDGLGDDGSNYSSTFFTQTAEKNIQSGSPPFEGDWLPQETPKGLAAFDGEEADGAWTLEILDNGPLAEGYLNEWSLTFNPTMHLSPPDAAFTFFTNELTALFTNKTTNTVDSYFWDFGDGSTNVERSPAHEFPQSGTYMVTMIATNANGSDTAAKEVVVEGEGDTTTTTGVYTSELADFTFYPNPVTTELSLKLNSLANQELTSLEILDLNGRTLYSTDEISENLILPTSLKTGTYLIRLFGENQIITKRLVKI